MILEDMPLQAYIIISRHSRAEKFKNISIENLRLEKNRYAIVINLSIRNYRKNMPDYQP